MERREWTVGELQQLGLEGDEINRIIKEQEARRILKSADNDVVFGEFGKSAASEYSFPPVKDIKPKKVYTDADITTLEALSSYTSGSVVELPSFGEGQPFIAMIRRPSMMQLAKNGKIPNSLMSKATDLFAKGTQSMVGVDKSTISEMYDIMRVMCEAALVKPTLEEIESVGLTLSDEQMIAIFSYTQDGIKALESFR